jgi:hypothetical protein
MAQKKLTYNFFNEFSDDKEFDGCSSSQNIFIEVDTPVEIDMLNLHKLGLRKRRWIGS